MKSFAWLTVFVVVVCGVCPEGWAHRYIANRGAHVNADTAIPIGDIDISQVVYHTATPASPSVWVSFEAKAGVVAKIQLGVPYLPRFESYRPAFALLGPGMSPLEELPFDLPEGYGGILYATGDITDPKVFDEEFTGTESWIFEMRQISLPVDGLYYIVGFVPSGESGKFWVAPGTAEKFGVMDILTLPWVIYKVRTFHEVFPFGGLLAWGMVTLTTVATLLLL